MLNIFVDLVYKDLLLFFRKKQILFIFVLPFILFALLHSLFSDLVLEKNHIDPIEVVIVDHEKSIFSKMLIQHYKKNESFSKLITFELFTEEKAKEKYESNEITAVIEIPKQFSKSLYYVKNDPITVTLNPNHPLKATILENVFKSYGNYVLSVESGVSAVHKLISNKGLSSKEISSINDDISYDLIFTALGGNALFSYHPIEDIPSINSYTYFLIGMGVLFLLYIGIIGANNIFYEKKTGCFLRMRYAPISTWMMVFSKLISLSMLMFLQVIMFILPVCMLYDITCEISWMQMLLFLSVCILFALSGALLLASIFHSEESATLLGNTLIFVCAILGGSVIPLQLMPRIIKNIAMMTPNYWMIKGFLFLLSGYTLKDIMISICVLGCSTIGFFIFSVYRFKNRWL